MRGGEPRDEAVRSQGQPGSAPTFRDPCPSALKGTGAQGRKAGIGAHTETLRNIAAFSPLDEQKGKRAGDVCVWMFDRKLHSRNKALL